MNFKSIYKSILLRDISVYTFFRLINRSLPILLLPFLTRFLKPSDYAIVDLFTNFTYIFIPLIGLNSVNSLSRFYYDKQINYKSFTSTVLLFSILTFAIFLLLSIIFNSTIFYTLNIRAIPFFISLAVVFSILEQIYLIHTTNLRLQGKSLSYGLVGLLRTFCELIGTLIIIWFFFQNWEGRVFGQFFGLVIVVFVSVIALKKDGYLTFNYSKNYLRTALSFSFPLLIHTFAGVLLGFLNRFFIIRMVGVHEAGIFASAYQLCFIISLFHTSFNEAWVPYLFSTLSKDESFMTKVKLIKITYIYFFFLTLLTILFIIALPLVYKIIGKDYRINIYLIIIMSIGFLFNGFYKMIVNYLFYIKKTVLVAYGTMLALVINIFLNYFLIKQYILLGASLALAFTFFFHFIIFLYLLNKNYSLPWFYFKTKYQ